MHISLRIDSVLHVPLSNRVDNYCNIQEKILIRNNAKKYLDMIE